MPRRISTKNKLGNTDVLILCGGKGTRLRSIIKNVPKPMAMIGGRPFLEILINYLSSFGIKRFILATGYRGNIIRDYFSRHKKKDLRILICTEKEVLGTGGALKKAKRLIHSDPFIVLNGDSFVRFDPSAALNFHQNKGALISMVITKLHNAEDSGFVKINKDSKIFVYLEKPNYSISGYKNCGVYICGKNVFNTFPLANRFSLEEDYFSKMVKEKFYGYVIKESFIDIGTPSRYKNANKFLVNI